MEVLLVSVVVGGPFVDPIEVVYSDESGIEHAETAPEEDEHECLPVPEPHAIGSPHAVVVHVQHAPATLGAVVCSFWLDTLADGAHFVLLFAHYPFFVLSIALHRVPGVSLRRSVQAPIQNQNAHRSIQDAAVVDVSVFLVENMYEIHDDCK